VSAPSYILNKMAEQEKTDDAHGGLREEGAVHIFVRWVVAGVI
jgi:hypothetical protein